LIKAVLPILLQDIDDEIILGIGTPISTSLEKMKELSAQLKGRIESDTLHIEGFNKNDSIATIFIGYDGCIKSRIFNERFRNTSLPTLVISTNEMYDEYNLRGSFVEIPKLSEAESTFFRGNMWYEKNHAIVESMLQKSIGDSSIVFIFSENNGFALGIVENLYQTILSINIQPVLFLKLPAKNAKIQEQITALAFLHHIYNSEEQFLPILLMDEDMLVQNNSDKELNILQQKIDDRIVNIFSDIILGSQSQSEFYNVQFENFLNIFRDAKGLGKFISYDIYDNSTLLSHVLTDLSKAESFSSIEAPTRGFLLIQPSKNGLTISEYKKFRDMYSNKDVIISILKQRELGSIIRGFMTNIQIPKYILTRYSILSNAIIQVLDDSNNVTEILNIDQITNLWNYERLVIRKRPQPKKD